MNKNIVITILIAMIMSGAGFFAGIKYQQSKRGNLAGQFNRDGNFQRNGVPGNKVAGKRGDGFRPVNGEIMAVDDKSITVKTVDGGSRIVILSESTVYNKVVEGTRSDLKVGDKVAVFGTDNTDGSVTAQNVQIGAKVTGLPSPAN